jgi:hypothetical protein
VFKKKEKRREKKAWKGKKNTQTTMFGKTLGRIVNF